MAAKTRLLGQDVQIRISRKSTGRLSTVTAVKNFTFEVDVSILTEKLLGEKFNRKDAVFEGVKGSFVVQPEDPEAFEFQQMIAQKAIDRRFDEDTVVLTWRFTFPDGKTAVFTVAAPEFGPMPVNSSTRDAYVEMPFTWECETYLLST